MEAPGARAAPGLCVMVQTQQGGAAGGEALPAEQPRSSGAPLPPPAPRPSGCFGMSHRGARRHGRPSRKQRLAGTVGSRCGMRAATQPRPLGSQPINQPRGRRRRRRAGRRVLSAPAVPGNAAGAPAARERRGRHNKAHGHAQTQPRPGARVPLAAAACTGGCAARLRRALAQLLNWYKTHMVVLVAGGGR